MTLKTFTFSGKNDDGDDDDDATMAFCDETPFDASSQNAVTIVKKEKGQKHLLTSWKSQQLRQLYKAINATYAVLESLYEAEKHQARIARKLSSFPAISS